MAIWSILPPLRIFYGHLEYFVVIFVYSSRFGMLHQEKSGNPSIHQPVVAGYQRMASSVISS
jgi:hypothetical protein